MNPFDRYTYTFNYDTSELEIPSVFLLTKRLKKIGILNNITDLKISLNALDPNEISFSLYKYYNDELEEHYSSIINQSVIWVSGFGCFELQVNESDNENGVFKSVSGKSLPHCELSQIQVSLEVNTDDDILRLDRENYINDFQTVFYRDIEDGVINEDYWSSYRQLSITERKEILRKSSLLHRLLSYAPHYEIGHIDETLYFAQREFSFDGDLLDCLSKIQEEINCIFTFDCYLDDDGTAIRRINAYDVCYCKKCYEDYNNGNYKTFNVGKYRSVVNGICTNCNSADYVYDYGEDTDIFITTENLTNEIQVQPENEVKNCFKVSGGDDAINSVVSRLQMTASNKIYHFSESQKKQMSEELSTAITKYEKEYNDTKNQEYFVDLVNTEYNLIDLITYLQHKKMPTAQIDDKKGIQEEVDSVLSSIKNDFQCQFYISSYDNGSETSFKNHEYTCASTSIKNLFTLYMDKGYGVSINTTDFSKKDSTGKVRWYGEIKLYEVDDRDNNYAKIKVEPEKVTTVEYGAIVAEESNEHLIEKKEGFKVEFSFGDTGDTEYKKYIEQYCETSLASYKEIEYKNREDKDWTLYCYERLRSYHDGYQACLDALDQMWNTATGAQQDILTEIRTIYSSIQEKIEHRMYVLQCQINALFKLYGQYPEKDDTDYVDYVHKDFEYDLKELGLTESSEEDDFIAVLKDAANHSSQNYIGDKPFACKKCGSSNVTTANGKEGNEYNYCNNCNNSDQTLIVTYAIILNEVIKFINNNTHDGFVTKYYLPFIGENVYGDYITPSIQDYKIITKDDDKHSLIYSYSSNSVEPLYYIKTPNNNASFKDTNTNEYDFLVENNGSQDLQIVVSHESVQGGWIKMSENTVGVGDICGCSIAMPHFQNNIYKIKIDLVEEEPRMSTGVKATVYKCYDPKGDIVQISSVKDLDANNLKGMNVWCSYQTNNAFDIKYEAITIDSVQDLIAKVMEYFSIKRYLGEDLYKELMLYIREDKYENQNYSSDGCNTNTGLIEKAQALIIKAKQELVKASEQQYTISSSVYSILSTKYSNWYDGENRSYLHDEFEKFKLGNWIRVRLDDTNYDGNTADDNLYKMRLQSIELDFENIDNTSVTYSNVMKYTSDIYTKISEAIGSMSSIATSYNYVSTQAEEGEQASKKINNMLKNGYDSALAAIKAGDNQDIIMDRHGLLFREYLPDINDYSKYQMKMINRNIVMTSDNWNTASLAIGLGMLPSGKMGYGIWADNIIAGKINVTEDLTIGNENESVQITKGGIILDGGAITWKEKKYPTLPQASIEGLPTKLQGLDEYLEQLDGRVQSYSQIDDPSTEWKTSDEKDKHKGDLWFNPSDGQTKRWNGTKWTVVTDSELVKLAQSKGQVFTTAPTPPYNIGDIWLGNDKSDLLVCKTAKTKDQEFSIDDWKIGVKYTDDTALNKWTKDFTDNIRPTIESQIDAKADTWYSSADPSISWTDDDKKNHIGDLWYKTVADGNGKYHTYIYNSSYNWEEVNGVPKEVFDMADGKASIYISKPQNGYKAKDLWILEIDNADGNNKDYPKFAKGTLLTATTTNSSYAKGDWDEKVKYSNSLTTLHEEITDYIDGIKDDLQGQIDGEIDSWFFDYDPELQKEPSLTWVNTDKDKETPTEQIKHRGDLFYNTEKGSAWRFIYNEANKCYEWTRISDEAITKALEAASNAQSTADSKCRTFYKKPTDGYDDGDLWVLSENTSLLDVTYPKDTMLTAVLPTGVTSRTEFVASDWVAITTKSAEQALSELSDLASDGVITPTEKRQLKLVVNDIDSTKKTIDKQCEAYGITTSDEIYGQYCNSYELLKDMLSPILANMNESSSIIPKDYNDAFSKYYTSLEDVSRIIELASKNFATTAANVVKVDLEKQIDGKIDTWHQADRPTWDSKDNEKHDGDLWYVDSDLNGSYLRVVDDTVPLKYTFSQTFSAGDKVKVRMSCRFNNSRNVRIYLNGSDTGDSCVSNILYVGSQSSGTKSTGSITYEGTLTADSSFNNILFKGEFGVPIDDFIIKELTFFIIKSNGSIQEINVNLSSWKNSILRYDDKVTYNTTIYKGGATYRYNAKKNSWEETVSPPSYYFDQMDKKTTIYPSIPSNTASLNKSDLLIPTSRFTSDGKTYEIGKVYKYDGIKWNEISYTDDTKINTLLDNISSDNVITRLEKADLVNVMKNITSEYDVLYHYAGGNGELWAELMAYEKAYSRLRDYMYKTPGILNDMNSDSSITKSDYDSVFSSYYSQLKEAQEIVNNHIQSAAEATASSNLEAYKNEVSEFQTKVTDCLGITEMGKDYVISPKIGGGYAYFTKGDYSVEIDPNHNAGDNTSNNYLFCIRNKTNNNVIMGVNTSGSGELSGKITANSGQIGGLTISDEGLSCSKGWGSDGLKNVFISNEGFGLYIVDKYETLTSKIELNSNHLSLYAYNSAGEFNASLSGYNLSIPTITIQDGGSIRLPDNTSFSGKASTSSYGIVLKDSASTMTVASVSGATLSDNNIKCFANSTIGGKKFAGGYILLKTGSTALSDGWRQIGTIPDGYRPSTQVKTIVHVSNNSTSNYLTSYCAEINANGVVNVKGSFSANATFLITIPCVVYS